MHPWPMHRTTNNLLPSRINDRYEISDNFSRFAYILISGIVADSTSTINGVFFETQAHWMPLTNKALRDIGDHRASLRHSAPLSSIIPTLPLTNWSVWASTRIARQGTQLYTVQADELQTLDLDVMNLIVITGEISAINNCTNILTNPEGEFRLTASEAQYAFADLSLYTNTESCPMVCPPHLKKWEHRSLVLNPIDLSKCFSGIRWEGFREYIYGMSLRHLPNMDGVRLKSRQLTFLKLLMTYQQDRASSAMF